MRMAEFLPQFKNLVDNNINTDSIAAVLSKNSAPVQHEEVKLAAISKPINEKDY